MNKELISFLDRNFKLDKMSDLPDSESEYFKVLQEKLSLRIEDYIKFRFEELVQILYRIDIPQSETDAAFDLGEIKKISLKLSELIIRRQLQKIDYSRKFQG